MHHVRKLRRSKVFVADGAHEAGMPLKLIRRMEMRTQHADLKLKFMPHNG